MYLTRLSFLVVISLCITHNAELQAAGDDKGHIDWEHQISGDDVLRMIQDQVFHGADSQAANENVVHTSFEDGFNSDSNVLLVLNPFVILAPELIKDSEKKREIVSKLRDGQQFFELWAQNRDWGWLNPDGYVRWRANLADLGLILARERIERGDVPEGSDDTSLKFTIGKCAITVTRKSNLSRAVQDIEIERRKVLGRTYTFPTVQECLEYTANDVIKNAMCEYVSDLKKKYLPVSPFYFKKETLLTNFRVGLIGLAAARLGKYWGSDARAVSAVKAASTLQLLGSIGSHIYRARQYEIPAARILGKYLLDSKCRNSQEVLAAFRLGKRV